jgi:hypothetical protein
MEPTMKVTRYLFIALLLSIFFATSALALPANKVLTVQLMSLSASGQISPARSITVTSDANGKVAFTFPNVPTSDVAQFLLVRILDGTDILRQSVTAAPTPNGTINVGISEVTTSQATSMIKAFADSHSSNATLSAMIMTMIRSGAISDADLLNVSPLARAAVAAFESFLEVNGAAGTLPAFRANLIPAMRDFSATYKESVDVALIANEVSTTNPALDLQNKAASNLLEAVKRGDAIARFLSAMVNAGVDAGISPSLIHAAFTEAGKAVEALSSPVSSDVVTAILANFRTGAEHCQLLAAMRSYSRALPFMNVTSGTRQPLFANVTTAARQQPLNSAVQQFNNSVQLFNAARATLINALVIAQESFEQIFADPVFIPTSQNIAFAQDNLNLTLQSILTNFIANTTASPGEITAIQSTLASRMAGMGGIMSGMSLGTLQSLGIGSLFTSPTATSTNWQTMMVAGANYVTPALPLIYTPSTATLTGILTDPSNPPVIVPPPPTDFSRFADPYKSFLQLQYDLELLKFVNLKAMARASQPITQTTLAKIKEDDLAMRNNMLQNISIIGTGNGPDLANAFMIILAQPELL